MFYRGSTVDAKCSNRNPEPGHVRVDAANVGSQTLHVGFEDDLF